MESADFFRQILFQPRLLRIRVRKTSPVKNSNLPLIYLLHLHHRVRAVLDFALFSKLVRPIYAFYAVSVRQTESLLRAYFILHLTMDALAFR